MSEWLKIVKKHAQLNKGKSLKEYLPDAKAEYDMLKKSGKIVLKSSKSLKKNKRRKKERKVKRKKKQKGGDDDTSEDEDEEDSEISFGGKKRKGGKRKIQIGCNKNKKQKGGADDSPLPPPPRPTRPSNPSGDKQVPNTTADNDGLNTVRRSLFEPTAPSPREEENLLGGEKNNKVKSDDLSKEVSQTAGGKKIKKGKKR